jgi:hypothetical protein
VGTTFSQGCSNENYTQEIQQLKRQLEIATDERNELEVSLYHNFDFLFFVTFKFSNGFFGLANA